MTPIEIRAEGRTARHAWSWLAEERIGPDALAQIRNIASLPVSVAVAVMPDAHVGYGMPIGTVLATKNAVVPYAVGVDIGCGMVALQTSLRVDDVRGRVEDALHDIYRRVPVGQPSGRNRAQGSHAERQDSAVLREWIDERGARVPEATRIRERADRQLGTLGGGNHFVELQSDGELLWLMFHTGSRSFGKQLCDLHHGVAAEWCARYHTPLPDKDLAFLAFDIEDGREYYADMRYAMRYAEESRDRIERACVEAMTVAFGSFETTQRIETHHNFAAVEKHFDREVIVHRKGAVRTTDDRGEGVLVTIPGSMQTGSYIGRGKHNIPALDTCSHGAGRKHGRKAVRRAHVGVDIAAEMKDEGIILVCPPGSDALDEAGRAYKDIEEVMTLQRDLVEPVVKLAPLGVVKG